MDLVCFQGLDKENFGQLNGLIKKGAWDKVFIVKNKDVEKIDFGDNVSVLNVDCSNNLIDLTREILNKLRSKTEGLEVALSIASGTGKEHMALISALLSIPVGIRFVAFTKKGVEFVN